VPEQSRRLAGAEQAPGRSRAGAWQEQSRRLAGAEQAPGRSRAGACYSGSPSSPA